MNKLKFNEQFFSFLNFICKLFKIVFKYMKTNKFTKILYKADGMNSTVMRLSDNLYFLNLKSPR